MSLCECGCGESTKLAPQTNRARGWIKGQPLRFRDNHHSRGLKRTPETRKRMSGENNGRWKGDSASYSALHRWVAKHKPKTGVCQRCGATGVRTENANLSGEYRRDLEDYLEMCKPCHIAHERTYRD